MSREDGAATPLVLEPGDEALTARHQDGRPVLAELSLPRRLRLGRDDSLRTVIHDLLAAGGDVDEAVHVVAHAPQCLAQLIRHVHAQRPLQGQGWERLIRDVQPTDEMLRVLHDGALHVLPHGPERPDAGGVPGPRTMAIAGRRGRSPWSHTGSALGMAEDRVRQGRVDVVVVVGRLMVRIHVYRCEVDLHPIGGEHLEGRRSLGLAVPARRRTELGSAEWSVLSVVTPVDVVGDARRAATHRCGVGSRVTRLEQVLDEVALEHLEGLEPRAVVPEEHSEPTRGRGVPRKPGFRCVARERVTGDRLLGHEVPAWRASRPPPRKKLDDACRSL